MTQWPGTPVSAAPAGGGAPAARGPVYGPPPVVDPLKQEDQQFQRNAETRASEDQQFQRQKFDWEREKHERDLQAGVGIDGEARESEAKAAAFLIRALGSNESYEAQDIGPRSLPGQWIADTAPNVLNSLPEFMGNSPERQVADSAQDEFIAASLRQDSGAAIPPEEMDRQRRIYFPMPGDSPEAIAAKRQARLRAIEGLKQSAGVLEQSAEARYRAMVGASPANNEQNAETGATRWPGVVGEDGKPLPPEGGYGRDPETGEWAIYGNVTDDSPPPARPPEGGGFFGVNSFGELGQGIAQGAGDIVETVGDTIGLVGNPLNQTINWTTGSNLSTDMGASLRDLTGLPQNSSPTASMINQGITSGLTGAGLARFASNTVAPGLAQMALAEYGRAPAMDALTGGAAAASGELVRAAGGGPVLQTLATVAGGASPTLVANRGSLAAMVPTGGRAPSDFDPSVVAAGERQGVPIRMGDAVPSARGDVANLETTPRGGPVIQQGRAADNARMEQRVGEVGGEGNPSDPYALGQRVQAAGSRNIERTRNVKNDMYGVAERLANGQRVTPTGAIGAVDRNIAELEAQGQNANQALLTYLRGLREDLSKADGFSITEFQGLRTNAGKKIKGDQALTATDADRRLGDVARAFTADAADQLPDAAANALSQADTYYSQRQDFIQQVLRPLMGTRGQPIPAEQAAERLVSMTKGKGNYDRFSRMWGELADDERGDVAATVALTLGRKANGDFSPATLIRSLDPRTGINPRTARLIFGEDGAKALDDLRAIAQAKTGTAAQLNNSRTGNMVNRAAGGLKTLVTSLIGYSAGGATGAVALPMARSFFSQWGEEKAARALMNPDFTRWLRNAPNTSNPAALNAYFKRLEIAAAKSPILANDIQGFREAANDALAQSPGQLAASEQEQN
jgi:hypothetical protein